MFGETNLKGFSMVMNKTMIIIMMMMMMVVVVELITRQKTSTKLHLCV
jgi:high-affinity Fe2+/Pb2+ permease